MAKLKEGQSILFKMTDIDKIRCGIVLNNRVHCLTEWGDMSLPVKEIHEWCDTSEAWNALTSQNIKAGNFEWNEGPTVEPIK